MTIVVFDTETTSLLAPEIAGADAQPYLIEFSGTKLSMDLIVIDKLNVMCKPKIPIPEGSTKVHGYTDETVKSLKPFAAHWKAIASFFIGTKYCVGHNLLYDKLVLNWELTRIGKHLNFPWPPGAICTVEEIQKIKGFRMNLQDLYTELVGESFTHAHSADADVAATVKVFTTMVERKMITLS